MNVGIVVAIVSTIIALLAAMALTRYHLPGKGPVIGTIMLPLVVPSLSFWRSRCCSWSAQVLDWPLSLYTIGAGHVLICVPFSMLVLMSRLEGFDKSLEEASHDLGENGWMTFWRVTFPLAWPGIVASLLMCFTTSFDEFMIAALPERHRRDPAGLHLQPAALSRSGCRRPWRSARPSSWSRSSS